MMYKFAEYAVFKHGWIRMSTEFMLADICHDSIDQGHGNVIITLQNWHNNIIIMSKPASDVLVPC